MLGATVLRENMFVKINYEQTYNKTGNSTDGQYLNTPVEWVDMNYQFPDFQGHHRYRCTMMSKVKLKQQATICNV